jgi:hypothetical protein
VDVVNQALDEIGVAPVGALTDGTTAANAAARIYWVTLRGILSAAPWNFARKEIPMTLLATGGTPTPFNQPAPPIPWMYMYEWPVDCVHFRYVPAGADLGFRQWWGPAPFLVHSYQLPNDGTGWDDIEGHDPDSTKVILCNVPSAHGIYTGLMQYPDAWDALFQKAFSLALAAQLALPCIKDRKEAIMLRRECRVLAVEALNNARIRDGDEGWTVHDHTPDWIRARDTGYWWGSGSAPGWTGWMPLAWGEDAGGVY